MLFFKGKFFSFPIYRMHVHHLDILRNNQPGTSNMRGVLIQQLWLHWVCFLCYFLIAVDKEIFLQKNGVLSSNEPCTILEIVFLVWNNQHKAVQLGPDPYYKKGTFKRKETNYFTDVRKNCHISSHFGRLHLTRCISVCASKMGLLLRWDWIW